MCRYACHPNAWFFLQEWINEADDEEYVDHSKEGEICSVFACWFRCYAWNCTVANSDVLKLLFSCLRLKRVDVCGFIMLQDSVTYTDFINKELVQFAKYDETPALLVAALIHPDSVGRTAWSWTIKSCCTILPINIMYNHIAYNCINMVLVVYQQFEIRYSKLVLIC